MKFFPLRIPGNKWAGARYWNVQAGSATRYYKPQKENKNVVQSQRTRRVVSRQSSSIAASRVVQYRGVLATPVPRWPWLYVGSLSFSAIPDSALTGNWKVVSLHHRRKIGAVLPLSGKKMCQRLTAACRAHQTFQSISLRSLASCTPKKNLIVLTSGSKEAT